MKTELKKAIDSGKELAKQERKRLKKHHAKTVLLYCGTCFAFGWVVGMIYDLGKGYGAVEERERFLQAFEDNWL